MTQRQVSEQDVRHALENYFERITTPKNSMRYRGPAANDEALKVWVFPDIDPGDDKVVKTVAWDGVDDE
jgi:hypothetical protein